MSSQIYILVSFAVLILVLLVLFLIRKKMKKPITAMAMFAFLCIITGIAFSDDKRVAYGFIGAGVVIAIIDIIKQIKNRNKNEVPTEE